MIMKGEITRSVVYPHTAVQLATQCRFRLRLDPDTCATFGMLSAWLEPGRTTARRMLASGAQAIGGAPAAILGGLLVVTFPALVVSLVAGGLLPGCFARYLPAAILDALGTDELPDGNADGARST